MLTPTLRTSMGGLAFLILLVSSFCVGGWAVDRGQVRHIRRITASDLPATPGNLTNATSEVPLTNQPRQLIVTEIFNKSTSKDLSSQLKELDGNEKPPAAISEHPDDTNTASSLNSKDVTKLSREPETVVHRNVTTQGGIDSEKYSISVKGSEYSSSLNVPRQLNVTEVFRGNTKSNISTEFAANDVKINSNATLTNSGINKPTKHKEQLEEDGTSDQTRPKEVNVTEVLLTSSSTYRRRRPVVSNNTSTASNGSQELPSELSSKSSKEVNINEVVSNRSSSRRLRKPILLIRKNGELVANHTRAETESITSRNCADGEHDCEGAPEADGGSKPAVQLSAIPNSTLVKNSSVQETVATNSKENSIDTTAKPKPNESSSVRPTDGAFNNIDFSSTARMVLQEKIHEDILHHLTTVSYAHYETDYVMDYDGEDTFNAESQSSSKNASKGTFGDYDSGDSTTTTPRVDSFDETYARISEGIQHNLDEIEERSVKFDATSERNEDHFGSSSDIDSSRAIETVPKNDTKVALEFVNHVDIIANNSDIGNAKRGDLTVANATHVDFERSFVESKVIPIVTSTFKYLIDDEFATTTIIPTNENSEEESRNVKEVKNHDQSLESAEEDAVIAKPDKTEESNTPSPVVTGNASTETPGYSNRTNLTLNTSDNQTITTLKSQVRGRMFPSERIYANNTNNVDQRLPESTEGKRLRSRTSQETNSSNDSSQQTEDTASPRSRSYLLRETSSSSTGPEQSPTATRRMSTITLHDGFQPTSPRNNYINTGRPPSRYQPQVNFPYRQGVTVTQEVPSSTSPRVNLLRPGRFPLPANTTYIQEDAPLTTTPQSNLIRAERPTSSRYPPVQVSNNTNRPAGGTRNDEGNDIPANNTPPTRNRGGTRFAGVSSSSLTNEEYPIPPTAAAWSLVTMKEPSIRTKLTGAGSKPSTTLQLVDSGDADSHSSGSYSKLTTVYNNLTPTASMDVTEKGIFNIETTTDKNSLSTESPMQNFNAGVFQFTTEDPNEEVTTQVPELTTINSSADEEHETVSPVDTTIRPNNKVVDDDALRFDVGTTLPPGLEFAASTTQQSAVEIGDVMSTTLSPETPRSPEEDSDKVGDDEEVDVMNTTTETSGVLGIASFSDTGMPEDDHGEVVADTREGEEHKTREQQEKEQGAGGVGQHDSNQQQMDEAQLSQGETDYGGPTGPDAGVDPESMGGSSTTPLTSSSSDDVSNEDVGDITTTLPDIQTTAIIDADDAAETATTTYDAVTAVYNDDEDNSSTTSADVNTSGETVKLNVTSTTTTTRTTDTLEANSTRAPPVDYKRPTKNVPSFLRIFVEASPRQFCETVGTFKKAIADLLTKGSGRIVSSDQVVLRNFGKEQCSVQDEPLDNSTSATGLLLPVELHLVDEAVNFDRQLNEAFTLIWGQEGMDFPLRILKVDVIATQDDFMPSTVDKAGVIAAIAISCIGAVCLLLLAVLLIVMRKRQKKFNYGMRCTPVSLDAYSLDSVSIHDSVRRKAGLRASKRSYGNPAFDDPSAPSHPLNFAGLSAFSTERGAMEDEFARIPHVTPKADELPPGSETKNRYANVLPLPETRVILSSQPQEQLGDYINANYVAGPKNAANFYIACQAPLLSTVTDFWRMVWEQQSKVIMMLTELVENGVEKCADYLPPSEVLDCHRLFGDFQVTLKKREVREKYVISTLQLKNLESNSWREITHLWYISWPSQGVPEEPNSMIAFLIEARSYMKNRSGPSVVHCSPGTGRTGTVLACDLSIREFEHSRQVDIPRCVAKLRRDRAGCVQTRDQYAFIYQVLNLYATKLTGGALDSI